MKLFLSFILTLVLGMPPPLVAFAENTLTLKESLFMPDSDVKLPLYSQSECEAKIRELLPSPDQRITAGLATVAALNSKDTDHRAECLADVVKDGANQLSEEPGGFGSMGFGGFGMMGFGMMGMGGYGGSFGKPFPKQAELTALQKKLICVNPSPDNPAAAEKMLEVYGTMCGGKFLEPEEAKKLQEEMAPIMKEMNQFFAEQAKKSQFATTLAQNFLPPLDYNSAKLTELQSQIGCMNLTGGSGQPAAQGGGGAFGFGGMPGMGMGMMPDSGAANPEASCKKSLSKEEFEKLSADYAEEMSKFQKAYTDYNSNLMEMTEFFSDQAELADFPHTELAELVQKLQCHNPSAKAADAANTYFAAFLAQHCNGKWIGPAEAQVAKEKLSNMLGPFNVKLATWKAERKIRLAKERKLREEKSREKYAKYAVYRLLARYRAFLLKNPASAKPAAFCADLVSRDQRDLAYQKAGMSVYPLRSAGDWKLAQEYGLSEAEVSAIKDYSGSFFTVINPALWSGKPLEPKLKAYKETMNEGMDRIPPDQSKTLRRFATLPPSVLEEHQVGSIVAYDAYTSTSKREDWVWGGNHQFLIHGHSGKLISEISHFPGEAEVLFKAGTRFKVLAREPDEKNPAKINFVLGEVDEQGNVQARP